MTKTEKKTKLCYSCETGTVQPRNLKGRTFDYRDERALEFDEDLTVPACDTCGELYLKGDLTRRFSEALERLRAERKQGAAVRFIKAATAEFPDVSRAHWEEMLGLSRGYLSRLASGARVADTTLEILLEAFARDPSTVIDALNSAGRLHKSLAAAVAARRLRNEVAPQQVRAPSLHEPQLKYELFENPAATSVDRPAEVYRSGEGTVTNRRRTPAARTNPATSKVAA